MFSDEMLSALTQKNITLVYFVELYYKSGVTRVHSHTQTLLVNEKEFYGVGNLGTITPVKATGDLSATRVKLTLGGLDTNLIKIALDEPTIGCPARIYLGILKDTQHVELMNFIFSGKIREQDLAGNQVRNQINSTCQTDGRMAASQPNCKTKCQRH